jgi:hypothetical protein
MNNDNKQFDTNSELHEGDFLRAQDIIPPLKNMARPEPDLQQTGQKEPHPPAEPEPSPEKEHGGDNVPEAQVEQVKPAEGIPSAPATTEQQKSGIPKFDLAEDIMAEHRRITAIRRKAPGQIDEAQKQVQENESGVYTTEEPSTALSEQEEIIAEIVARDIERLCRGGSSSFHNL